MKKYWIWLLLFAFALFASACGAKEEEIPAPEPDPEPVVLTCPLDGTVVEELPTRLFAVAIDNGPKAEPQSGVDAADLVFELPVEGGITRFLAFFYHAQPEKIGPVRSARHYVIPVAQGFNGVYIHCGQSYLAEAYFSEHEVEHINEIAHTSGFWRDKSRRAPVNLYTSWENLVTEVTELGWYTPTEVPAFSFYSAEEEKALPVGTATEIHIPYKYKEVDYLWDGNAYLRQSDGKPHVDAETGATLSAVNVIVQYAPAPVVSDAGHLDIDFFAGGSGLLFQKGQAREIRWLQRDAHSPQTYTYADSGEAVKLVPGKTFVNVVPDALTVTYPQPQTEGEGD